jgi:hypothetical protein
MATNLSTNSPSPGESISPNSKDLGCKRLQEAVSECIRLSHKQSTTLTDLKECIQDTDGVRRQALLEAYRKTFM